VPFRAGDVSSPPFKGVPFRAGDVIMDYWINGWSATITLILFHFFKFFKPLLKFLTKLLSLNISFISSLCKAMIDAQKGLDYQVIINQKVRNVKSKGIDVIKI